MEMIQPVEFHVYPNFENAPNANVLDMPVLKMN